MDYYQSICIALLASIFIQCLTKLSTNSGKNLPPGPAPFPVIGNLHLLGGQPHKSLTKLAGKYGPVMMLRLGMINTVVISSSAIAREALQKQDLFISSNRATPDVLRAHQHHQFSVIWLPVAWKWRTLRKILNVNIFSHNRLDENQHLRAQKMQELITYCQKQSQAGEAVDIGRAGLRTNLNMLSNTLFSKDLCEPYSDSGKEFRDWVWSIMEDAGRSNFVDFYPFLEKIDPQKLRSRMRDHFGKILDLMRDLIDQRLEETKTKEARTRNPDLLDTLLGISQETPEVFDEKDIQHLLMDLFIAGADTSSNTMEWAMAELLKNPKAMTKARAELEEVIGKGRTITETDVARLPYLQCIVKEALRLHPPSPLLVPRKVEQEVALCGYTIPKGSNVMVNVWAIGRDPNLWKDPLVFNPDRFWNSEIDARGQDFELIPFGAGRRICPAMPMAMRTVPMMLGSLLNSFEWKIEGNIAPQDLDMEERFGFSLAKAQPLRVVPISL